MKVMVTGASFLRRLVVPCNGKLVGPATVAAFKEEEGTLPKANLPSMKPGRLIC
jgi:hypothetical protein